jgi:hypothetical protein
MNYQLDSHVQTQAAAQRTWEAWTWRPPRHAHAILQVLVVVVEVVVVVVVVEGEVAVVVSRQWQHWTAMMYCYIPHHTC